jgi:hypothetical protein
MWDQLFAYDAVAVRRAEALRVLRLAPTLLGHQPIEFLLSDARPKIVPGTHSVPAIFTALRVHISSALWTMTGQ